MSDDLLNRVFGLPTMADLHALLATPDLAEPVPPYVPASQSPHYVAPEVAEQAAYAVPMPDEAPRVLIADEPDIEPESVLEAGSIYLVLHRSDEGYYVVTDWPFGLLVTGRMPSEALLSWAEAAQQLARSTADPVSAAAAILR